MLASTIPDTGAGGWLDVGTVPTEFEVLSRALFKFLGGRPGQARLRPRDRESHAYLRTDPCTDPEFTPPPVHGVMWPVDKCGLV